jgi:hypothetical protein
VRAEQGQERRTTAAGGERTTQHTAQRRMGRRRGGSAQCSTKLLELEPAAWDGSRWIWDWEVAWPVAAGRPGEVVWSCEARAWARVMTWLVAVDEAASYETESREATETSREARPSGRARQQRVARACMMSFFWPKKYLGGAGAEVWRTPHPAILAAPPLLASDLYDV